MNENCHTFLKKKKNKKYWFTFDLYLISFYKNFFHYSFDYRVATSLINHRVMTNERDIIFQQNAAYFRFFSYLKKKGSLWRVTLVGLHYLIAEIDSQRELKSLSRTCKTLCKLIEYQVHLMLVREFVISITNKANQMSSTQNDSRKFELVSASPEIHQYKLPTMLIRSHVHLIKVEN